MKHWHVFDCIRFLAVCVWVPVLIAKFRFTAAGTLPWVGLTGLTSRPNSGPMDHWTAHIQHVGVLAAALESVAGNGNCLFRATLASKFSELAPMCIPCRVICVSVVCVCVRVFVCVRIGCQVGDGHAAGCFIKNDFDVCRYVCYLVESLR